MSEPDEPIAVQSRKRLVLYAATAMLAIFVYWWSLDSGHIPTSTDELTYAHITRLTALSGQLLPLRSDLAGTRNPKPPLLFWQGIASTNWGKHWSRWSLRYPNVIYTLLTGVMVFLLGHRLSGQITTGLLAFLIFLAFFSTFRYGRSFITDPPLIFWLFVPFFATLYTQPSSFESRLILPLAFGIILGIGALYKSPALAAPLVGGLGWWFLDKRQYRISTFVLRDAWKLALIGSIALCAFSAWFILDPDRQAIWEEFVLRENVSTFNSSPLAYIKTLLWSHDSVWKMLAAYPINAGLLAFPLVALFYIAYRDRSRMPEEQKLLWMCVLTYLLAFTLPTQRSERYVLPAMPALAVLMALNWEHFNRKIFSASIIASGVVGAGLSYMSISLQANVVERCYPFTYWLELLTTGLLIVTTLFFPRIRSSSVLVVVFLVYLCFAQAMSPLDGRLGTYSAETQRAVQGRKIWAPNQSVAKNETYRFLLPGANIQNYGLELSDDVLSSRDRLFLVRSPVNDSRPLRGKVIGERLDLASRQNLGQMMHLGTGQLYDQLFIKELLIQSDD